MDKNDEFSYVLSVYYTYYNWFWTVQYVIWIFEVNENKCVFAILLKYKNAPFFEGYTSVNLKKVRFLSIYEKKSISGSNPNIIKLFFLEKLYFEISIKNAPFSNSH